MNSPDVAKWELEFSFKREDRCKKFIKKLLKLHYTVKFTYYNFHGDEGNRYYIQIEDSSAKTLTTISKLLEKVDYKYE